MTSVDTLTTDVDFKRDRWGRPQVTDPAGGKKMLSYGRPSSFGDAIADKYSLQKWGKRQVALGMALTPSLIARALAAGGDSKALDAIAEDALTASKSGERADIGTALHRIIERQIAGEAVELVEPYSADVMAFWQCLNSSGFKIHRHDGRPMSEIKCANDVLKLAGTFDFVLEDANGRLYIGDLKTGSSLDFGHIGYAVQLAVYADAVIYDVSTDTRSPLPEVERFQGIIVHLPAGTGTCSLKGVDLTAGREMALLCAKVLETRKVKTITDLKVEEYAPRFTTAPTSKLNELCRRVDALLADGHGKTLGSFWPVDIVPAKDRTNWGDHLELIDLAVMCAERELKRPFGLSYREPLADAEPQPSTDDPVAVDDELDIALGAKLGAELENQKTGNPDAYSLATKWAAEAAADGYPVGIKAEHSRARKRCARVQVILHLCRVTETEARQRLALVLGDDAVQPAFTTGAIIGTLTYAECLEVLS